MRPYSVLAVAVVSFLCGCSHNGDEPKVPRQDVYAAAVSQRAGFDLSCGEPISVQSIGAQSYGVAGCGRRASYTCICMWSVWGRCTKPACTLDGMQAPVQGPPPGYVVAPTQGAPPGYVVVPPQGPPPSVVVAPQGH